MQAALYKVVVLASLFLSVLLSKAGTATPGSATELRLQSDYIPLPIRLKGDALKRDIHSIRVIGQVPTEGTGAGQILLDTRPAELNAFGDVAKRIGPEPARIRVELRYLAEGIGQTTNQAISSSAASRGFRLYDLVFPSGELAGRLKLVLGTATLGPHRLLVYGTVPRKDQPNAERLLQIVPLQGDPPIKSALPDASVAGELDLSGYYVRADGAEQGRILRLEVRGIRGGAATLVFDPNHHGFDAFGEPTMSTAMGYQRHEITLKQAEGRDPLGLGRKCYWAVPKDPRNTNRVAVVLGRAEAGPHRILVYRGDQVELVVPAYLMDRRRQEIVASELAVLPASEQTAIADLRGIAGHGFSWQIETGQVVALNLTGDSARVPPSGVLARLPHVRSIHFGHGRFPVSGVADLQRLRQLRTLFFDNTEFEPKALATLKDLRQIDSLSFYDCRGITDEGVRHLGGLTGLKQLSFYSERLHRKGKPERCITDAGVAHLKALVHLQHLDLFGHDLTDASAGTLTTLADLRGLALSGHGFTDAGLDELARLPKLRNLRLFETSVTTNGVARLKQRLPGLEVQAWGRDAQG